MLEIKVSSRMSDPKSAPLGRLENYVIRLNPYMRYCYNLKLQSQVKLLKKDGKELSLTVKQCLPEDKGNYGFVTKTVFEKINLKKNLELVAGTTIGCDPEFIILNKHNDVVMARRLLKHNQKIGSDGFLGELRPDPSEKPEEVIENLHQLILEANHKLEKYKLIANSAYSYKRRVYAAGFHLHYGIPKEFRKLRPLEIRHILKHISKVMDFYIAIPCMIPERGQNSYRRLYTGYGQSTDFKFNNKVTLEYRVPGSYYLRNKTLSAGLLSLGCVVFGDVLSKIRELKLKDIRNYDFRKFVLERYNIPLRLYDILKEDKLDIAFGFMDKIRKELENLIGYDLYKQSINQFFDYIDSKNWIYPNTLNWGNK